MSFYNFKKIQVVPTSTELIDIILSKTQRKTPTVVHPGYQIGRIRSFYMRKVKFACDEFCEKLNGVLGDFPKLDEIHPFYSDLMNILYDRDHYKLALGQINTARHLIDQVGKDYSRLLKFGDSLYRCKQLKRAALGRMATIMKRQKDSLAYLEQVRQHLARLPSIDPNTRTLLVCGYPNVGKSSFMNKVTRAEVEVQPYAFTTKSLFVGHMDYKYLRWQCIDTPGILDHPLEDRNTIEMQSITALAHLRACILFFIDLSEQCGYSIADQVSLYHSIKPLFVNKPIILVINKIDQLDPSQLDTQNAKLLREITDDGVQMVKMSCHTEEGVMDVRNTACEILLQTRVESKMRGTKINTVLNKLHMAVPEKRDDKDRPAVIPPQLATRTPYSKDDPNRRKLARDIEAENGGAGVFNVDLKQPYILKEDDWKYDTIPEIMDGKNVADFIDPEIEKKLMELEEEEEKLVEQGFYESDMEEEDEETQVLREAAEEIRSKKTMIVEAHRMAKNKNRPVLPAKSVAKIKPKTVTDLATQLKSTGVNEDIAMERARSVSRKKRARSESRGEGLEIAKASKSVERGLSVSRAKSVVRDRSEMGIANKRQKLSSEKIRNLSQRIPNLFAKRGESDRQIGTKMPKHLFAGKRGNGTTDRR